MCVYTKDDVTKMYEQGIDNQTQRSLAEGVSMSLHPAGLAVRTSAYLFDFFIRLVAMAAIGIITAMLGKAGGGIFLISYFVVSWGYYIYFEGKNGQTPGKKRYGLVVVQDNGLPAHFAHAIIRNLLRVADSFPFVYALGIVTVLSSKEFKRIGDWAAGTLVVYKESTVDLNIDDGGEVCSPPIQLSTTEQLAIIEFAKRCDTLSEARQVELANVLAPVLGDIEQPTHMQIKAYARYYIGQSVSSTRNV